MKKINCDSDIGAVLIGNSDWTFAVPNVGGDGTTRVRIYKDSQEFIADGKWTEGLTFISSVQGTFNIYQYDCAYTPLLKGEPMEKEIRATLSGRYLVYSGLWKVAFVQREKLLPNGSLVSVSSPSRK